MKPWKFGMWSMPGPGLARTARGRIIVPPCLAGTLFAIVAWADPTAAQTGGHGVHPPMPGEQLFVTCRSAGPSGAKTEIPLAISSALESAELHQSARLAPPHTAIVVKQYLPASALRQTVIPDESGKSPPAVEVSIVGPTQSFSRWLAAGDPDRNRLTSFIATWRLMTVKSDSERRELLRQFEDETSREPRLVVSRREAGPSQSMELPKGKAKAIEELGCEIEVLDFYPDYAVDRETKKVENRSQRRLNPAARVRIRVGDRSEERWVFAKFPEFASKDDATLPYRVVLDCPVETEGNVPDFAIVVVEAREIEVWERHEGRTLAKSRKVGDEIEIPGSPYRFRVSAMVPAGRVTEEFQRAERGKGPPALHVEIVGPDELKTPVWLELGKARTITPGGEPLTILFGAREVAAPKGHP